MAGLSGERQIFDTGVTASRAVLPDPPSLWSYSTLKDVETCPRRYALARADYPDLWDKHGYPQTPIPAAIKGDVVHGALEVILKALARAGCPSTTSAEAVAAMRELGGYSAVLRRVLERQLARFEDNPRVDEARREHLVRTLTDWLPDAREQVQSYLNRLDLKPASTRPPAGAGGGGKGVSRRPAWPGDHAEQELIAQRLRLRGRVDLLSVVGDGVAITDFKTGVEDTSHHDQLRTYALLWAADTVVNPKGLPVASLVAAYPTYQVAVPVPDAAELADLSDAAATRVAAADAAVATPEPLALPGEQCALCSVRPLCAAYWAGAPNAAQVSEGTWFDLQGTVVRGHGVKSWVVRETSSGREVLVRTPAPSLTLPLGRVVRILGARRTVDPDADQDLIASMTRHSEVFELA